MLRKQALNNLSFTVPKNRKPKFELTLRVIDLTNIPLVVGHVGVKWHLPSSSSAEHRGRTKKARIREHRATWEYTKHLSVRLTIDKNTYLQPCDVYFEILQEFDSARGGRVHLGNVKLNLAEYTNIHEHGPAIEDLADGEDGMITRRYLMQDSKVNATLKVGIAMKQIDGDTNFIAPPLRSAMVIGGIAGIISAETGGDPDDMPSIASKSRELSEAQDIYRRTLAASWACEKGELPPDKLIENLFSGGDGGTVHLPPTSQMSRLGLDVGLVSRDDSSTSSDADSRRGRGNTQTGLTPDMARSGHRRGGSGGALSSQSSVISTVSGRGSIEQQMKHSTSSRHTHNNHQRRRAGPGYRETTEFDLRDDLRSWHVDVEG
ncbi:hypothetical protein LTR64_007937 [Lithohypha guttulata]|uniref:uncharacterized protein n=1 Tax=Lithohypha guttulata TaxID=1690604 RepID=UPI002DE1EEA6|nr:hypothetical protein LTR51_008195 [Lithohypha guttulata]